MSTGVLAKIQEVMKLTGYVQKDGKNQNQGYGFLSDEKLAGELHPHMAEVGLIMYPSRMEIVQDFEGKTSSGGIMRYVRTSVDFTFASAEDSTSIVVQVFGEGSDTADKAMNKAMTAARKYALRLAFVISTGDDPDNTTPEATTETTRPPQPQGDRPKTPSNPNATASFKQIETIRKFKPNEASACKHYGVENITQLTMGQASELIGLLIAEANKKKTAPAPEEPPMDMGGEHPMGDDVDLNKDPFEDE